MSALLRPRCGGIYIHEKRSRIRDEYIIDFVSSVCYVSYILAHLRRPSSETRRRRSGEGRPAAAARNRLAPGGSGPRPPGTTTWLRGARSTDPEEMPEKEARPPAQNRHGGAPRGERVPLGARRASGSADRRAPQRATTENLRLPALRSPLMGRMEQREAKPGRSNARRERRRLRCLTW